MNDPTPEQTGIWEELNESQRRWLKDNRTVRVGLPNRLHPVSYFDEAGNPQGIVTDYLSHIGKTTGIQFDIVEVESTGEGDDSLKNRVDILLTEFPHSGWFSDKSTRSFLDHQNAIVTNQDAPFITDLQWLVGKKVFVMEGSTGEKFLQEDHHEIEVITVNNMKVALRAVSSGEADAFVGCVLATSYVITKEWISNLKLAGMPGIQDDSLCFAVRADWPQLRSILNKSINRITEADRDLILRRWIFVRYQSPGEFEDILLWAVLVIGLAILMLLAVVLWNRQLRYAVVERTRDLEEANLSLTEIKLKFEAVYNHHYQLTGLLDNEGRMLMSNNKALDFAGVKLEQIVGTLFWETPFWRHSQALQKKIKDGVNKALKGEFVQFEIFLKTLEGELRSCEFCISPVFDKNGEVIYLVPEAYDLTEHKKVEQALRLSEEKNKAIVEHSPIAIALLNMDGDVISINKSFRDLLGYSLKELKRMAPDDCTHPDDIETSHSFINHVKEENPPFDKLEKRYIAKDGSVIWVNLNVNRIRTGKGKSDFIILMIENISKRKEAEKALKDQLSELQRWQEVTIDREERMVKLKEEVDQLAERLGEAPRYGNQLTQRT